MYLLHKKIPSFTFNSKCNKDIVPIDKTESRGVSIPGPAIPSCVQLICISLALDHQGLTCLILYYNIPRQLDAAIQIQKNIFQSYMAIFIIYEETFSRWRLSTQGQFITYIRTTCLPSTTPTCAYVTCTQWL